MTTTIRALLCLLAVAVSTPAAAYDEERFYGALMGTYLLTDTRRDTDNGYGGHVALGMALRPSVWLEIGAFTYESRRKTSRLKDFGTGLGLDVMLATSEGIFRPFLLIGAGAIYEDIRAETVTSPFVNVGLGMLYRFTPHWGVRAEGRYYAKFNDRSVPNRSVLEDGHFNLGLQYAFGVRRTEPEPPPPRPEPTPPPPPPPPPVEPAVRLCDYSPPGLAVDEHGCIVQQDVVLDGVAFEFDSDRLTPNARTILRNVARALRGQPHLKAHIIGHTDSIGPSAYNLRLSERRAESVRKFLVSEGVAAQRLTAEGQGEFNPIASNTTDDGRALNRRVEFRIVNDQAD